MIRAMLSVCFVVGFVSASRADAYIGSINLAGHASTFADSSSSDLAAAKSTNMRIHNLRQLATDDEDKPFGISTAGSVSIRLSNVGEQALRNRDFTLRVFRVDSKRRHPHVLAVDDKDCEIFVSWFSTGTFRPGDTELVAMTLSEKWLARRGTTLGPQSYLLMLEEGHQDYPFIKIKRGLAEKYFSYGFRIVVQPDRALTAAEVKAVFEWMSGGALVPAGLKDARCVDEPYLRTEMDSFGERMLSATFRDCRDG